MKKILSLVAVAATLTGCASTDSQPGADQAQKVASNEKYVELEASTGTLIRRKTTSQPSHTMSREDAMTMDRSTTPYKQQ